MNKINFIYILKSNKYIYSLFVILVGSFLWLISNNFDISTYEKGYDSFRYLHHALYGCEKNINVCFQPIVTFFSYLGDNSIQIYLNYLLLAFIFLVISLSKKLLPYLLICLPTLIYFMGQPGKDSFSIIGTLSLLSILIDLDLSQIRFNFFNPIFSKKAIIFIFRLSIIIVSLYLRFKFLIILFLISIIFLTIKYSNDKKNAKLFKNSLIRIFFILLIVFISIYRLNTYGLDEILIHSYTLDTSSFGSERYTFLIGNSLFAYFARFIFYFFFTLLFPFRIIINNLLLNPNTGYITFFAISLLIQNILLIKNKIFFSFFYHSIPIIAILSGFIFPHLRYLVILYPALIIIASYKRDKRFKRILKNV